MTGKARNVNPRACGFVAFRRCCSRSP